MSLVCFLCDSQAFLELNYLVGLHKVTENLKPMKGYKCLKNTGIYTCIIFS